MLSYDLENWKIFTDKYFKLTPYEAESILDVLEKRLDSHMIIDLLSLAQIIGQSISLTTSLISRFSKIDLSSYEQHIDTNIKRLLNSPIVEERRVGLMVVGFLDKTEFFEEIERMSNYDILFEDAYFSLSLLSDPKVIELLGTKFMYNTKNHIQRSAIAKILVQRGNPLAALWLYRSKGFDFTLSYNKAIFIARELAWAGLKPAKYLSSNDDFIQPITIKFVEVPIKVAHPPNIAA